MCQPQVDQSTSRPDRRRHARTPLAASVTFRHLPSGREFPGRCVDISAGGLLMYVPAAAPLQAGHEVELSLGPTANPKAAAIVTEGTYKAHIVRVERHKLPALGHVPVGVEFARS